MTAILALCALGISSDVGATASNATATLSDLSNGNYVITTSNSGSSNGVIRRAGDSITALAQNATLYYQDTLASNTGAWTSQIGNLAVGNGYLFVGQP